MRRLLSFLLFSSFLLCQNIETIVSNKNVSLNESLDFIIKLKNIDTNPEVNFVPMLDYFSIISGPNIGSEYKFINGKFIPNSHFRLLLFHLTSVYLIPYLTLFVLLHSSYLHSKVDPKLI